MLLIHFDAFIITPLHFRGIRSSADDLMNEEHPLGHPHSLLTITFCTIILKTECALHPHKP